MNQDCVSILKDIQKLVSNIQTIERGHNILETDKRENVVEHSFAVTMLCWRIYEHVNSNLNLEKILKYSLAHDFLERGLKNDVNTYASDSLRIAKKELEKVEFEKFQIEFTAFDSMLRSMADYEAMKDEEARFVWCIDKIQALILGSLDTWRSYEREKISFQAFFEKGKTYIEKSPDCLKDTMIEVVKHTRDTYYEKQTQK